MLSNLSGLACGASICGLAPMSMALRALASAPLFRSVAHLARATTPAAPPHHVVPHRQCEEPHHWYDVRSDEERVARRAAKAAKADADSAVFESTHPSQPYANLLTELRTHYPASVWNAISSLFPSFASSTRSSTMSTPPTVVDIAIGNEGRCGVQLARRGFRAIGIEADPHLLARTFEYAQSHDVHLELMTAKVEHSLLHDGTADAITMFHGLHLVDHHAALKEAWRLLKPKGRLIVGWNDRDVSSPFISELEDIAERHVPGYNRWQKQRGLGPDWGEKLQADGLFHLLSYSVHPNPVEIPSHQFLIEVLDAQSFVRAHLSGAALTAFHDDITALLSRRFHGRSSFVLPLESKLYVLEKRDECETRATSGRRLATGGGGMPPLRASSKSSPSSPNANVTRSGGGGGGGGSGGGRVAYKPYSGLTLSSGCGEHVTGRLYGFRPQNGIVNTSIKL